MGKNPKKEKRTPREVIFRSKEERQSEVREIMRQLSNFELTAKYEPIQQLYKYFKIYIEEGERMQVNIPFPMINRRIKGLLATSIREEVWIKLQHEKF